MTTEPINLNHVLEIYVPTQCRCRKALPDGPRQEVFEYVKTKMLQWFGGGTVRKGTVRVDHVEGIWVLDDGSLAAEQVDVVYSQANAAQLEAFLEDFQNLVAEIANRLTQEGVACRIDRKMKIYPSNYSHDKKKHKCASPTSMLTGIPEPREPSDLDKKKALQAALMRLNSIEQASDLFRNVLHYEYADEILPTTTWTDTVKECLADGVAPQVIADQNGFQVIYLKLREKKLLRTRERPVIERLIRDNPSMRGLILISDFDEKEWHLINIKYSKDEVDRTGFVIRRMNVGPGEYMRTTVERLAKIDIDVLGETTIAQDIQAAHDIAFDVQAVTKEFFRQYRDVFYKVESAIRGFGQSDAAKDARHLFTQQLFNRLMFIAFIQKKGWLKFNNSTDYLRSLWQGYQSKKKKSSNFYCDCLKELFFNGFNNPDGFSSSLIGKGPFLNGGLFEEDENDKNKDIIISDDSINLVLFGLIARFNFTVSESTPLDQEVAVDPEMLGLVFEELVTGRHETGSYYTPKSVVSFMCSEVLKKYLKTKIPSESDIAISDFVDYQDCSALKKPETVLDLLRTITICDPACGSGAYLLGMMQELKELRNCLFKKHKIGSKESYDRKLDIIQNNLYGVDIDPFATNIAKLRLWLSLAIEYDGIMPPPLPNLDFKIESGDSLIAPNPKGSEQQDFRESQVRKYQENKSLYMTSHGETKRRLGDEIQALRTEISLWSPSQYSGSGFNWEVEFAEIFKNEGFDIILANPPYVRADAQFNHIRNPETRQETISHWRDYRTLLLKSKIYETLYEKWDYYIPFLERAFQLLKPSGQMVFIISDAYNASKYAKKSHEYFLKNSRIERIDFCSEISLFKAGIYNTIIQYSKNIVNDTHQPVRVLRRGTNHYDFEKNEEFLWSSPQIEFGIEMFRPARSKYLKIEKAVNLEKICYISYGIRPNAHDRYWPGEFTTRDCLSSVCDKKHPKLFLQGKNVKKWCVSGIQYLEWNTDRAPRKFARPTFIERYEVLEKLIAVKVSKDPRLAYDTQGFLHSDGLCSIVPWHYIQGIVNRSIDKAAKYLWQDKLGDREIREQLSQQFNLKYVLAVLNSSYIKEYLASIRRNKLQLYPDDWKKIPIPQISLDEQQVFVKLIETILEAYKQGGNSIPADKKKHISDIELEVEVDRRVQQLYECK